MTQSDGSFDSFEGPTDLPRAQNAGTIPEQGLVFLSLEDNPFGASLTTPHIFVARRDRGQQKYVVHSSLDRLLVRMLAAGRITGAMITGAEGGNLITLNLTVPESDAPEFSTYSKLVELINWLNAWSGSDRDMQQIGEQFAHLMDLHREDRRQFSTARTEVYATVRKALVNAFNHALEAGPTRPQLKATDQP